MTHGTVLKWLKQEGDSVEIGDPLFEVETDKVNAEVEAEAAGILRRIVVAEGEKAPVLGLVAFIGSPGEPIPPPATWASLAPNPIEEAVRAAPPASPSAPSTAAGKRIAASPAARRLARRHGIALESLRATGARGEVTRADVEAAVGSAPSGGDGKMDREFLDRLRTEPESFVALPSEEKVRLYRRHGARIGERVRIERGAIVIADEIDIGAAATIGADSTIVCTRLRLGRLASLGKRTRVRGHTVEIGDALWSKDDVVIGGGGSSEPGARLKAGETCFFGEGAYINIGYPVTFGDEVCIGSRAMLFTHSHWQSVLRGYSSVFGPITVGDHVFIGNNAFIFPGVTIGAGATVTVNSFVPLNVPPQSLVGGVPAQVIRRVSEPPREEQVRIMRDCLPELAGVLEQCGFQVSTREEGEDLLLDLGARGAVRFAPVLAAAPEIESGTRAVFLTFSDVGVSAVGPGATLFDLAGSRVLGVQDRLSDEVREFCRRRGIRFRPRAWRYGLGHFENDRFVPRD